jgi:hypothetical protein
MSPKRNVQAGGKRKTAKQSLNKNQQAGSNAKIAKEIVYKTGF